MHFASFLLLNSHIGGYGVCVCFDPASGGVLLRLDYNLLLTCVCACMRESITTQA